MKYIGIYYPLPNYACQSMYISIDIFGYIEHILKYLK